MNLKKSALRLGVTSLVFGMQIPYAAAQLWIDPLTSDNITSRDTSTPGGPLVQTTLSPQGITIIDDTVSESTTTLTGTYLDTATVYTDNILLNGQNLQYTIDLLDQATLDSANTFTKNAVENEETARIAGDAATLEAANTFTTDAVKIEETARIAADDATLKAANTYTDTQVSRLNSRVDDVEKTAYRGVAIALAAQQAIPNIKPGQFAIFGGVGHYEGESAGALGMTTVFANGRTSLSAAVGVAGSNEVGGRVGVSYVFGGK
ncbi:YadA C-terminal domain-containing protein [Acinetobacter johnsonii]|uniref:YadA C-terminal domain-containing protein n=1 Tax=Acinetobacter johnsonii TaxID=40214 RepID=UPI003D182740